MKSTVSESIVSLTIQPPFEICQKLDQDHVFECIVPQ